MAVNHPAYLAPCGWQAMLVQRCPEPNLRQNLTCELAVVGAGYTGLAAARTWADARPQDRVAVLDAGVVGECSSGRGAGLLVDLPLVAGRSTGLLARRRALLLDTLRSFQGIVGEYGIDCGMVRIGCYRGAATGAEQALLKRYRSHAGAAGIALEELTGPDFERRLGTAHYRYGLYQADSWAVQPAAAIRGLADTLPGNVTLYEESSVIGVHDEGGGWRVETATGSLLARRVVLAINGFVPRLGIGRTRIAAGYAYAGLTAPLPHDILDRLGPDQAWGLLPAADGRLLVHGYGASPREVDPAIAASRLVSLLTQRFPALDCIASEYLLERAWGGAVGLTRNGGLLWGEPRQGLLVSAGCNGLGMLSGLLLGRLLAERALGRKVPEVDTLFGRASRMLPEPVRRIGSGVRSLCGRWGHHDEI